LAANAQVKNLSNEKLIINHV